MVGLANKEYTCLYFKNQYHAKRQTFSWKSFEMAIVSLRIYELSPPKNFVHNECLQFTHTQLAGDKDEEPLLPREVLSPAICNQKDPEDKIQCYCCSFLFPQVD